MLSLIHIYIAGDGTTTATVLAQAFVREGLKNVAAGANPMVMRRGISKAVKAAVAAIAENSKKVDGTNDIARVGAISSEPEEIAPTRAMSFVPSTFLEFSACLLYTSSIRISKQQEHR